MAEPLPTGPRAPRMPPALKILLGATIGCGVLLVIAFVAGTAGMFWFLSPGEQVPTRAILGPGTVGVLRVNDLAADDGAFALLARAFLELDRAGRRARSRELPESMRWLEALGQANREQSVGGIKLYVPRDATATLELLPGDDRPRVMVAANLRMFPRLIRGLVSWVAGNTGDVTTTWHEGREVQVFASGSALAFHGGTLLWTQDEALMARALDRIVAGTGAADGTGEPAGVWDLHGELDLRPETLAWLEELGGAPEPARWARRPAAEVAAELHRLSFQVDVISDDALEGVVSLECSAAGDVADWTGALSGALEMLRSRSAAYGVEVVFDVAADGSAARGNLRATGLRDAIAAFAERLGEEAAESGG